MAVTAETLRRARQLRNAVGSEADSVVRSLTSAWSLAWSDLTPVLREALLELSIEAATLGRWPRPWEISRLLRLGNALLHVRSSLDVLAAAASTETSGAASRAIDATVAAEPAMVHSQLPAGVGASTVVGLPPPGALDMVTARVQARIASTSMPLSASASDAMRRSLIRGVAIGASPRATAAKMLEICGGDFNGGLSRALNIARTETLDAYRSASREMHAANADLLGGWQWLCALDRRSCPACIAKHGSIHPVGDPGPLDHQSGRCSRIPLLRSWRELGIDLNEPPSVVPDARVWFAGLPEADRVGILGPGRLGLLDSGLITWDDIPKRRTSAQWRDSYAPRSLSELRAIAAKRTT